MAYYICLCSNIYGDIMGSIQVPLGDKLPNTTELQAIQLALQWMVWAGLEVIDDLKRFHEV